MERDAGMLENVALRWPDLEIIPWSPGKRFVVFCSGNKRSRWKIVMSHKGFPPSSGLVKEPSKQHDGLVYLGNLVLGEVLRFSACFGSISMQVASRNFYEIGGAGIWTCQWSQSCVKGKHSQFQGVVVMLAGNPRVSAFLSLIFWVLNTKRWRKFVLFKFAAKLRTVALLGRITAHAYPMSSQYILQSFPRFSKLAYMI